MPRPFITLGLFRLRLETLLATWPRTEVHRWMIKGILWEVYQRFGVAQVRQVYQHAQAYAERIRERGG